MRLVSVSAQNFRSYAMLTWNIPGPGLYLIDGENLDTGRNNMTGKTTLVDSIFWGLYGYLPKWGGPKGGPVDAVIKRGESSCSVTVDVVNQGRQITVTRERPSSLKVSVDGQDLPGKASDLNDRIPALVGMTADQFLTAVYISQDRKQSFFTMGEADRTKLLSDISGVENVNRALERARQKREQVELVIEKQKSTIEALEVQAAAMPGTVSSFESELKDAEEKLLEATEKQKKNAQLAETYEKEINQAHEQNCAELRHNYENERAPFALEIKEFESELSLLEMQLMKSPRIEAHYTQRIEDLKAKIAMANSNNLMSAKTEADNAVARAALANIANEIESTASGRCEHCGQDLPGTMREKHIADLLENAKRWEEKIKQSIPKTEVEPLQAELDEAMQAYATRKAEIDAEPQRLRSEIRTITTKIESNRKTLSHLDAALKGSLATSENIKNDRLKQIATRARFEQDAIALHQERMMRAKQNLENILVLVKQNEENVKHAKAQMQLLLAELDEALDLIDLFKGFRQVCFEDLIARISDRSGQLLSLMTDNVYTTRIDQMGETGKGEAKLILKPIITKSGQDVPLDDLSGGARRTVMLAYDVAVAEACGDSNVLFLDEALDGLDAMGKAEALRLLEEVSRSKAVLVIDHASEIKAAFSQVIKVTYKNETSHLH